MNSSKNKKALWSFENTIEDEYGKVYATFEA